MNETSPNVLEVRHLTAAFERGGNLLAAVDDVSFNVPRGKCVGIVGESGCGKSVTAMSIVRLLPQPAGHITAGQVLFKGEDVLQMPPKRLQEVRGGGIGVIFQEPMKALNPVHTIGSQIAETLMLHRSLGEDEAWQESIRLLERVRIPAADRRVWEYPGSLSGGMRQRVVLAMAIACRPELVIADEPTTALDVTVQDQVLSLLRKLQREDGTSTLLITHDLGVVAQNCDRVLVMYAGRVVESADAAELFAHPVHAYTRALLASMPRAEYARKSHLPAIPGNVASLAEHVPGCRFCQRMGVDPASLTQRPPMQEISPGHWVQACPRCTQD